jgi:serine/threonine protein kinase
MQGGISRPQWNTLVGHALGQYQIVELIGKGGMAIVWKAWRPALRHYVALKLEDGYHYITMEFIEGASLKERICSRQILVVGQVVDIVSQIGSVLWGTHR